MKSSYPHLGRRAGRAEWCMQQDLEDHLCSGLTVLFSFISRRIFIVSVFSYLRDNNNKHGVGQKVLQLTKSKYFCNFCLFEGGEYLQRPPGGAPHGDQLPHPLLEVWAGLQQLRLGLVTLPPVEDVAHQLLLGVLLCRPHCADTDRK